MASFTFHRQVAAPPELVFDLLVDHRGYAEITRLRRSTLEREGEPPPNGVGAIRVLSSLGPALREEVLAYDRPTRFSYKLISGAPVRDHLGTVALRAAGGGTDVVYAVRLTPTVPLGAALVIAAMKLGVRQLLDGIATEAERRAALAG